MQQLSFCTTSPADLGDTEVMSGENVRAIRHLLGWSQQDMAERLRLSDKPDKSQVSRIENGQRKLKAAEQNWFKQHVREAYEAKSISPDQYRWALRLLEE